MTELEQAAQIALEALEWSYGGEPMPTKEIEAINAIRQALDQSPDTTKMIDNVYIRYWVQDTMESGHWATTDSMERTTAGILLSGVYGNTFERGEIVEQSEMPIDRGAWSDVPNATQWLDELRGDESNLLNQTCCGCGKSNGFALYCGWCWGKGDEPVGYVDQSDLDREGHDFWVSRQPSKNSVPLYTALPVDDVTTSEERVPNAEKQRHEWQGLTREQRNNIMQEHGNDWKRYTEAVERQLQKNNS